jgi:hypothetical protein
VYLLGPHVWVDGWLYRLKDLGAGTWAVWHGYQQVGTVYRHPESGEPVAATRPDRAAHAERMKTVAPAWFSALAESEAEHARIYGRALEGVDPR